MIDFLKKKRPLSKQSPADKMVLLKLVAEQKLGAKWAYFKKIKHTDAGLRLLSEASLMEQMKATQSALRFTSKTARKAYWSTFKAAIADVKSKGGVKSGLPELPEVAEGEDVPSLTPSLDAFIISWTPVKFLLNSKLIRDKGVATQRHSEGLVAKLMFKVAGYYADPRNWNIDQLCFYLRKIDAETDFPTIVAALEPLKKDLLKFAETYEPFKFGKSSLAKDAAQEADTYDDAFGEEPMSEQLKTLYLYHFIYEGTEQFLLKYYCLLVFSCPNIRAIRYLAGIFEPAIHRAIENKNIFLGSFETDRSKKAYGLPYDQYRQDRRQEPLKKRVESRRSIYESWVYNLPLLERYGVSYRVTEPLPQQSGWTALLESFLYLLFPPAFVQPTPSPEAAGPGAEQSAVEPVQDKKAEEPAPPQDSAEVYVRPDIDLKFRWTAFVYVLNQLLLCSHAQKEARSQLLERFKKRVLFDRETAQKRVAELKKQAEKKIREMTRKVTKLRRMKQEESAKVFEADIEHFRQQVEVRGKRMIENAMTDLSHQKRRLKALFDEIAREKHRKTGVSAGYIILLAQELDETQGFLKQFTRFVEVDIEVEYVKALEPFYSNLFEILHPSIQDKTRLVQALDISAPDDGVRLTLTEEEKAETEGIIDKLKAQITALRPDIFKAKLLAGEKYFPVEDLLSLSLSNQTWAVMFEMKFASAGHPKPARLENAVAKALMALNMEINPVRANDLQIPGRKKLGDPENRINLARLAKLHQEFEQQNPS